MSGGPKADEILGQLRELSRRPFQDILARMLDCAPSDKAIKAQAEKFPDRWAQAVTIMGRLGGYTEKAETTHNYSIAIHQMSDAEVMARLAEYGIDPWQFEGGPKALPTSEKPKRGKTKRTKQGSG